MENSFEGTEINPVGNEGNITIINSYVSDINNVNLILYINQSKN